MKTIQSALIVALVLFASVVKAQVAQAPAGLVSGGGVLVDRIIGIVGGEIVSNRMWKMPFSSIKRTALR